MTPVHISYEEAKRVLIQVIDEQPDRIEKSCKYWIDNDGPGCVVGTWASKFPHVFPLQMVEVQEDEDLIYQLPEAFKNCNRNGVKEAYDYQLCNYVTLEEKTINLLMAAQRIQDGNDDGSDDNGKSIPQPWRVIKERLFEDD